MELLSIAAILLGFLALLLGAGVWIGVALMATGWAGMQFAGGGIPAGSVLATTVWGNSASWSLAALPLFIWMGEILFRTRLSEEMFRGFAPWLSMCSPAACSARSRDHRLRPAPRLPRSRCRN